MSKVRSFAVGTIFSIGAAATACAESIASPNGLIACRSWLDMYQVLQGVEKDYPIGIQYAFQLIREGRCVAFTKGVKLTIKENKGDAICLTPDERQCLWTARAFLN